jgi:hypothetical protein
MTSYHEFWDALMKIKAFDQMMCRVGLVKSNTLSLEVQQLIAAEET